MAQDAQTKQPFASKSVAGSKRKRETNKYYAVRTGKRPGIYDTWEECSSQVNGFKNAQYKSFSTRSDAEDFIAAKDALSANAVGKGQKFYAVHTGRNPGVYSSWLSVQAEIAGIKDARHRRFDTRAEAEAFVATGAVNAGEHAETGTEGPSSNKKMKPNKSKCSAAPASIDLTKFAPGEAPLPAGTEDGFDNAIILDAETGKPRYRTEQELSRTKPQVSRPAKDSAVEIWTDGASSANGTKHAFAGVGVHFGPGDKRNVSEGLSGARQTNQRAELTAIARALELAPKDRNIIIYSDSNYSIKCVTEWYVNWRRNNWHASSGKPVENKDLVSRILDLLEERQRINQHRSHTDNPRQVGGGPWAAGPAGVRFQWIKGHANDAGNVAADKLATDGAANAKRLYADFANDDETT